MNADNSRNTLRKRIICQFVEEDRLPILLEELRWNVFELEMAQRQSDAEGLTESYKKSFNRTIRAYTSIRRFQLNRPELLPSGLVTRAAAYRMDERGNLNGFLSSPESEVFVCVEHWQHPPTDQPHYVVQCIFRSGTRPQDDHICTINLPLNLPIILLSLEEPATESVLAIAKQATWRIRRNIVNQRPGTLFDVNNFELLATNDPVTLFSDTFKLDIRNSGY